MVYSFAVVLEDRIVRVLEPVFASTSDELVQQAVECLSLFPSECRIVVYERDRVLMSVSPPSCG